MSLPGFTADVSLYTSPQHYRTATTFGQADRVLSAAISPSLVLPAACDQECRFNCLDACTPDCLELVGSAKGACLRACRNACRADCGC
jgi:hypothetical protein